MTTAIPAVLSTIHVSVSDYWGKDLQRAIETNDFTNCSSFLSKHPGLMNSPLPNGEMPLHYAVRRGCQEFVKSMIQNPTVAVEGKDHQGLTPADHALLRGDQNMIAIVLGNRIGKHIEAAQIKPWSEGEQQLFVRLKLAVAAERSRNLGNVPELHSAAGMGNLKEVQRLATPQNMDVADRDGMTPLHYAAVAGREDVVSWLIGQNSRIDLLTSDRKSVLHLAAIGGNDRILQTLLQTQKLDPNAADTLGRTPLHFAMAGESFPSVRSLIQYGADPTIGSHKNWVGVIHTPLDTMVGISREQMEKRDPLALSDLQMLLFLGIAVSWISHYCGGNPQLKLAGLVLNIASTIQIFQNLKSTKAKLAFLALIPVSWIPGFNILYRGWTGYIVGKGAIQGLAACWKNRFLETYRPIRNAIVHSVTGFDAAKSFVDSVKLTHMVGSEAQRIKEEWDDVMEMDGEDFANMSPEEQINFIQSFINNYINKYHSGTQYGKPNPTSEDCPTPKSCGDITDTNPLQDCILNADLKPKECENHAEFILNLSKKNSCKTQYHDLSLLFHADKNKDPKAGETLIKVQDSARKMGCLKN